MPAPNFYLGDIGVKLIAALTQGGTAYDLGTSTVTFLFIKPTGDTLSKSASIESPASDGKASYAWAAGNLDEAGVWHCIVTLVDGGATLHTRFTFTVGPVT